MKRNLIGVDLGSVNDWTSIALVERSGYPPGRKPGRGYYSLNGNDEPTHKDDEPRATYRLRHLERHMGEPYTKIAERIEEVALQLESPYVVVDATGVGRPVVDLLAESKIERIAPVTITGGDQVTSEYVRGRREWRVPKKDLVGCLQVLLQNRWLETTKALALRSELTNEMQNFKVKLNAETGHASFEHWRSTDHDDLVLAVALACWYGENR